MNNNNKKQGDFLKENGLLVGLYSVVGVLVVTAGVLTVRSIEPTPVELEQGEPVNSSVTKSYDQGEIGDSISTNIPNYDENALDSDSVTNSQNPNIVTYDDKVIDSSNLEITASDSKDSIVDESAVETSTTSEKIAYEPAQDVATVAMYTAYNEGDPMDWPVVGEVVLPYSNLLAIYDPTLDQFRTNELISIESVIGQDVKASAEGQVVEVSSNEVSGNYVTIQHGNGWMTTYGQLDSALNVKVGDVVGQGFVLGKTTKPTKYSVALGDHVDFKVTHNDETVNPASVLVSN